MMCIVQCTYTVAINGQLVVSQWWLHTEAVDRALVGLGVLDVGLGDTADGGVDDLDQCCTDTQAETRGRRQWV